MLALSNVSKSYPGTQRRGIFRETGAPGNPACSDVPTNAETEIDYA
jgi:hypothetical protein